jgi:hypothetical protein
MENHPKDLVEGRRPVSLPRTPSTPILTPSNVNISAALRSPIKRVSSTTSYSSTSTKVMTFQHVSRKNSMNHHRNTDSACPPGTKKTTIFKAPIVLHPLLHPSSPLRYDFLLSGDHPRQKQNLLHSAQFPLRPLPFNAPAFPHNTSITKVILSIEETSWLITVTPASNQFYITIQAVLSAIQNFLSQPIADVTWNAASSQARSVAEKSCAKRGGNVKRRVDWLGGKTKFDGLTLGVGGVENAAGNTGPPADGAQIWLLRLV